MRRSTTVAFLALGAALVGLVLATVVQRLNTKSQAPRTTAAASPQVAPLHWREVYGNKREHIVFGVRRFEVLPNGWRANVSLTNDTPVPYEVGDPRTTLDRAFGLMLFDTGRASDLKKRNSSQTLPAPRAATGYKPGLPDVLQPGASWQGTISARGPLVAGSFVRFVFGTLVAVGRTPDVLAERVVWITDHAYRLRA